jgi:hypothetical protein
MQVDPVAVEIGAVSLELQVLQAKVILVAQVSIWKTLGVTTRRLVTAERVVAVQVLREALPWVPKLQAQRW